MSDPPTERAERRGKPGVFAILERELQRSSRRPQTYALRATFAAALVALVAVYWSEEVQDLVGIDRQSLANKGQVIFQIYVWVQWAVLAALTPILVAQTVIEEREGRTLELLTMTRLTPGRILVGKWRSRLLGLELLVLAGMPVLAIVQSLGGVEQWQLANVWIQSTVLIGSTGAVAAFLALYANGPFSVAIATWMWMFFAYTMGSIPHGLVITNAQGFASASPVWSLIFAESLLVTLGPLISYGIVAALVLRLGALGFRAAMSGADDPLQGFGTLSGDFEGLRKTKTRLAVLMVVLLAMTPGVMIQKGLEVYVADFTWARIGLGSFSFLWGTGWTWLATAIFLLVVRAAYIQLGRRRSARHKRSWKELMKNWEPPEGAAKVDETLDPESDAAEAAAWGDARDVPLHVPLGGKNLSGRAPRAPIPARKPRFAIVRQVWRNPVLWRETVTRAHGGLSTTILRVYVVVALFGGFFFSIGALSMSEGLSLFCGFVGFAMSALVILMTASASIAGELRSRTLELLCATKMGALRILWGKLVASWMLAGPAFVAGFGAALLGVGIFAAHEPTRWGMGALIEFAGVTFWYFVALTAVVGVCHWIGLRAETASRVWMWTIAWATAMLVLPPIGMVIFERIDEVQLAINLLNPLLNESTWEPLEPPVLLFASTLVWIVFTAAVFIDNARQLPRRAARG